MEGAPGPAGGGLQGWLPKYACQVRTDALLCSFPKRLTPQIRKLRELPLRALGVDSDAPASVLERIAAYRRDRDAKLQQARRLGEYEELKGCTFAPQTQTHARVKMPTGPVVVRGLGRYLELKEMAKRQADEKRSREEKAFMVKGSTQRGGRDSEGRAYTVPEPFALSYRTQAGARAAREEALRSAVESKQMKECTFKPKTMAGRQKRLIKKILAE